MANKQKNFANVFICSIIFLIAFTKYTEGAFIGQQTITNGLSSPNLPNYPFYHNNLLHLLVGVKNASIGTEASLVQYNSGGSVVQNVTFPLPCLVEDCNIEGALFGLVNNSAYFSLRRSESNNDWACMIYQIDLTSFQIVNISDYLNGTYSYYCSYSLPLWTPYNSTHCVFSGRWFEYATLSIVPDAYNFIYPVDNLGGSSTALSNENLLIYTESDGYSDQLTTQNVITYDVQVRLNTNSVMMVFLGDNSTNVAVTTPGYDYLYDQGYDLILLNAANLDAGILSSILISNYPQTGMFADSSNNIFYIGELNSGDEKGVLIHQYNVNVTSNSLYLLDKLTLVNYQTFPFYPAFFSVLSWGLNEATQQFAVVAKDLTNDYLVLQLIDYDNSHSPYYY